MIKTLARLLPDFLRPTPAPADQVREDIIQGLRLSAGDTMVISCERILTFEQIGQIEAKAARRLPAGVQVLVLVGGLKVAAVHTTSSADAQMLGELRKHTAALKTIADCGMERVLRSAV